ncbi:hypothetical protein FNF29_08308 [Cafeteria roenbergensis]|uniref:Reverse transcriptase domain-containing protein n=1 Tax=Cafeteria roenbergensis TaxID=33653 RepID=A0A5A8BZL1_CAFRO|nr:hypothetical protein FNF29_08308 [Cafeteria roenbergensis]|eukprot:KAA0145994.1 hypothetical protein FNF29_08308 [Cafeteria roenbergensis]
MAAAASLAGAGRRGNAEGHPTVEQAAGIRVQLTTVAALKAYLRRQNGTSAKDLAKSMASAGTVAQDRETLEALMDLHPSEEEVVDGTVEGEAPDLTDSELREMVSAAIQSMPHKKAVGPDGMVAKQLENIAEKDLEALVSFVRRALRNDLSAEERRVLGSSTLMAIPKGNGKIRPVAMVSGLGKLVGKVVNTILGKHGLLDQLRFQFLGCRDGSCRLVHAVRTAFEEGGAKTVVVALDMANAYNSVSRRAMIEEVRRLDEKLVPAVLALYGSSSPLLFATDEGEVFELKSNRGVRQGDPAAGALFAIAVHPLVDEVRRAFPDVLILQMADDTTLVGPRRSAFKAAQMLAERLSTVGLRMNADKTQCPVGEDLSPEVALEQSMKRLEKEFGPAAERLLAGIEVCGLKRAHHLLLSVLGQKFSYLHRAAGAAAGQELAVFHAALLANLAAVAHKTELDAIGHALSDEMCTVTEDGFREAMSKAIEALVRGLPDEHARREAWWALLGREADGVTRLASAASNPALKKGGYAQMRLAKMLSKGCKAGGMGLPGVAQFRFEAAAGFIEAVRDMRKGRDATKEVGDILLRCEEVAKGAYRDYERDSKEYKDACTEARYFRPDKDCVVGKEADLHAARVKKRYQLAHVWRSDIAGAVEGLEELRAEIEELALEAMMELRSDDESSDDMEAAANLVEEGNAEGHPTVEQAAGIRVQLTTVAALKAYLRRQNGTSAKDLAKSMASAGTVAQDRETLEALMDLHPSEEEVVDGTVEGEAPDLTDSELREMVSAAIQSMPHKKAVGPDGMVAKQLENIAEKDLEALVSFVRRALRNDLSAEERRVLGSSTLMAIPKGNGKIRPVAMVSGLGKLVGKVVNTILGKHGLLDQLRFQFLGCRDGSCRLVHAVRTAFEEGGAKTVVVALDMANAYNSVSRRAMIEEVRRLDEKLVPAVLALYGSSSPLLFATDEGEVFELKSNRGVRQGDPAAGALFAIAVHPLVDEVRRAFPDVLILQMADDTTLVGPRRSAFKAAQMLAERLSTVGLRMNADKTQVLCKRGQREETKARIQRVMKRSRDDPGSPPSVLAGCHLTERSVAVLQCPVGEDLSPEVALEQSMKRLEKEFGPAAERLLAGIEVCGLKRAHHLLLSVLGQKFSYLHRAAGAAAGQELAVFHAALLANLAAVAHKTELDAIGHALSDEMCTVTEDGFREAMSKAIEALVRGLPDEHARREAWWALLGREADGVTRLASAASNPALKKGGYAQMRLAKMLSKGCKAGGMGLPGVAQFRFEATAGFIEAVRDMRKGRFEMAPPPEEALDGPGTGGGGGEPASGSGAGAGPANAGEAEAEDESGAAAAAAGGTPWVDHPAVGESESKEDCDEGPAHGQQLADI